MTINATIRTTSDISPLSQPHSLKHKMELAATELSIANRLITTYRKLAHLDAQMCANCYKIAKEHKLRFSQLNETLKDAKKTAENSQTTSNSHEPQSTQRLIEIHRKTFTFAQNMHKEYKLTLDRARKVLIETEKAAEVAKRTFDQFFEAKVASEKIVKTPERIVAMNGSFVVRGEKASSASHSNIPIIDLTGEENGCAAMEIDSKKTETPVRINNKRKARVAFPL